MSPSSSRWIVSLLCLWGLLLVLGCRAAPYTPYDPGYSTDPSSETPEVEAHWHTGELPGSPAWTGPAHPGDDAGLYAYTDPGRLPELRDAAGNPLPLRHTAVHAALRGHVAAVQVWQRFHNASTAPIEVVYVFPLPENSAVSDLRMIIGERVIQSDIMRRDDARETYEGARAAGHTAALLEQERPNVFTQSVANIAPGEDVVVEIRYLQTLTYDSGEYEFVFPMVVGPRFIPGGASVPDAARISPPIAGPGVRTGHDVSLEIDAQAGPPILAFTAPTHEVEATTTDGRLHLTLANKDELPNRDFVLRYRVAGPEPSGSVLLGEPDASGQGHFLMVVHPPATDVDAEVGRREVIFVVDRSGSMSGAPLGLAKETVRELLARLRPVDTFDVVGFASGTERLFGRPRPANTTNLAEALRFLDAMESGGGTMMNDAVQAALSDEVAPGWNRYVLFLTDGWVGNETEIFAGAQALVRRISQRGSVARVFGIAIGSAPNRYLIEGIAAAGNGQARDVSTREHPRRAVDAVMHDIDSPVLSGLEFSETSPLRGDHFPTELPDLFVSQPLVVMGRYRGEVSDTVVLHGHRDGIPVRLDVPVHRIDGADALLPGLWARAKVEELSTTLWHASDLDAAARTIEEITSLGLQQRLVTPYTAFVAVDGSRTIGNGNPELVLQPGAMPEGVQYSRTVASTSVTVSGHGISLAGTTGAESKYTVEGASINNPRFGTVGASIVQEYIEEIDRDAIPSGLPQVRVRIGRLELAGASDRRVLRAAVRDQRERLRGCVEGSPLYGEEGTRTLVVELVVDALGSVRITLREGSLGDADSDACVTRALESTAAMLPTGGTLTLSLHLSAT
jgi:Ca-activated chloride channel family protein